MIHETVGSGGGEGGGSWMVGVSGARGFFLVSFWERGLIYGIQEEA